MSSEWLTCPECGTRFPLEASSRRICPNCGYSTLATYHSSQPLPSSPPQVPTPAPKQRSNLFWFFLFAIPLIVVILGVTFLAVNANKNPSIPSLSSIPSTPTPTATPSPPQHFKVGQTVQTGDKVWLITIVQAKEAPDQYPVTAGYVYLLLEVKMGNISATTQNADPLFYQVRDQVGDSFNASIVLPDGYPVLQGNVASQDLAHGWLGFEVPPDQHQFTLNFNNFTNSVFWDISVGT